jgi:hypothetical protein
MRKKLGVRAKAALSQINAQTPAELQAYADRCGTTIFGALMRIPFCGRKTVGEIMDWSEDQTAGEGHWVVTATFYAMESKEEACNYRDKLMDAMEALPESASHGGSWRVVFEQHEANTPNS